MRTQTLTIATTGKARVGTTVRGCVTPPGPCAADLDGSGLVDTDDLLLINSPGPLPPALTKERKR